MRQGTVDRIANDGPAEGKSFRQAVQRLTREYAEEFNAICESTVLRAEAPGDGTFNVCFGDPGPVSGPQR